MLTLLGLLLCSAALLVHVLAEAWEFGVLHDLYHVVYVHHRLQRRPQILGLHKRKNLHLQSRPCLGVTLGL